jgi:hypothetical protein
MSSLKKLPTRKPRRENPACIAKHGNGERDCPAKAGTKGSELES